MSNRLSKIVTRTGDDGTTGLADGTRRLKSDLRIQSLGEIDELNSIIGLILTNEEHQQIHDLLIQIQHDLFDLGAELSQPGKNYLGEAYNTFLDQHIELFNAELPPLREFILPGGSASNSYIHLARCVSRRAERSLVELHHKEKINPASLQYLNRLSDLLFILARYNAKRSGQAEHYWQSQFSRVKKS